MSEKSFYDLDYIIEVNEQRFEQYTSAYQKVLERLTNILIVYSALTIFLVPIVQDVFLGEVKHWLMIICFTAFSILFLLSITYSIKLIIPVEVAFLEVPKKYYEEYRLQYEQTIADREQVKSLLKASYINELEIAIRTNEKVFKRKSSFYYNALMWSLLSAIPYLVCLGFHISKREDKVQKVEIVESHTIGRLQKIGNMERSSNKTTVNNHTSSSTTTTTTQLPGINPNQVISSSPNLIKENSQNSSTKK